MTALVLIADADPKRRDEVRRLVERGGPVAITATEPVEAMRLFVRREPQVTLIHVDPSSTLGLELCRDMKRLRAGRGLAVIVAGARASRADAFAAGCDAFIALPLDDRSLRRTIRHFLATARRSAPADDIELIA